MNQKGFVNIIITIGVVILASIAGYFIVNQRTSPRPVEGVSSFDECVKAGYPVGESYPRQCWTPDGKHFVEGIPTAGPITVEESNTVLSINSLSPKQGPVGTKITIRGTRFNTRGNVVAFGPVNIGGIDSPDRMTISFTIPSFGSSSCTAGDPTICTRDAISIFPGEHKVVVKTTEGISNSFLFIVTQ